MNETTHPRKVVLYAILTDENRPVSRYYSSLEAAGQHLESFRVEHPGAHIIQYTFLRVDAELLDTLEHVRALDLDDFGHLERDETERLRERDRLRTALQAPIAAPAYTIHYRKPGSEKEYRSPYLYRRDHADKALAMMQEKYGEKNAIIWQH